MTRSNGIIAAGGGSHWARAVDFMRDDAQRECRVLRPAGALYQADLHLAQWCGAEGFTKQITLWKVRPELCADSGPRDLLREDLRAAARLSTALVTQVLDLWREEEALVVAVEHLAGVSLARAAGVAGEREEKLPVELVLAVLLETARALESAHQPRSDRGAVVHGDLRPQNILLGREGAVKLTGFGFARFLSAQRPRGWWCVWDGWCYQAPERFDDDPPRGASDVFSLGLILAELVAGWRPWGTDDATLLLERLEAGASPLPVEALDLPPDLAAIVSRACAVDPAERFSGVDELAEALHAALYERGHGANLAALVRGALGPLVAGALVDDVEDTVTTSFAAEVSTAVKQRRPAISLSPLPAAVSVASSFVGRTEALRRVSRALAATSRSVGSALVIIGEAGMGRTRLIEEVTTRLSSSPQPRRWILIRARPSDRTIRFAGVLRLFGVLEGLESEASLAEVGENAGALAAYGIGEQAVAAVRAVAGREPSSDPAQTAALLGSALITAFGTLVREQPTIVVWDDLHWADAASLALVDELFDHLSELPAMALMTAPAEFQAPWRASNPRVVELGPLERSECEELVVRRFEGARWLERSLLSALEAHCRGNPLLIVDVIERLEEIGRLVVDDDGLVSLTGEGAAAGLPSHEEILGSRLESMGQKVYLVAVAVALAGPSVSREVLAAATEVDETSVGEALERLVLRHRLLRRDGPSYSFVHELHRRALLSAVPDQTVEVLRGAVARAILEYAPHDAGLDEVAATLLTEDGAEVMAAQLLADRAGEREAAGSLDSALTRYLRAAELARSSEAIDEAFELRQVLGVGRTALRAMRLDVAEGALRQAVELARRGGAEHDLIEASILLLRLLARQGRLKEVKELAKDAIPLAETTSDPRLLARAYGALGEAYQQWGRYGPDLRYVEAAVSFATESGDEVELAQVLRLAVTHAAGVGEDHQSRLLLEQVRPIVDQSGDPSLQVQLLKAETLFSIFSRDYEGALQWVSQALPITRAHGLHQLETEMLHNSGDATLRLGRPRQALSSFAESLRRSRAGGYERLTEMNEMYVGFIEAAHLGQQEGFERIRRALSTAEGQGRIWNLQQGHELLGRALLARGDRAGAQPHLTEAVRYARQSGVRFFIEEAVAALRSARAGR